MTGESVSAYTATLRKLAAAIKLGPLDLTTRMYDRHTMLPLDVMRRDRFLCDLRGVHIQQRRLAEQDLSFMTAYNIALHARCAVKQQQDEISGR